MDKEIDAPPDRPSAVDQAVRHIRDLIRNRAFVVGDVLPAEAELATMFGASRNTIREAVRTLKAYGILESRQKIGAIITDRRTTAVADLFAMAMEISADTFRDIQGFRRLTELNLGPFLVGRMSEDVLSAMHLANERMAAKADPVEASEHDFRFHQIMVEAAGNQTLVEIYEMLKPVICRLMQSGKAQRRALDAAAAEHAAIIEALRGPDVIDFQYHMNRHLGAGLRFIPRDLSDTSRRNLPNEPAIDP